MTTTIRLRGPADIIAALPYHLGYRPSDSLLVVCLRGTRLGAVARIDLPPPDVDARFVVDELLPLVLQERPDRVVLVGFESTEGAAEPASVAMRDAVLRAGFDVADRLLVRGGRWWSRDCEGECCPADGAAVPADDEVPGIADYIVLGRRPATSRERLSDRLAHCPDRSQDIRCAAVIHDLARARTSRTALLRRRRRALAHWSRILDLREQDDRPSSPPRLEDECWAWAVVSLLDVPVRDLIIAWLCPGTLDLGVFPDSLRRLAEQLLPSGNEGPDGPGGSGGSGGSGGTGDRSSAPELDHGLVERLAMVCRAAPRELSPGPLTVLAHVAWWLGDGALSRTALDLALAVDPDYRLAALLERMVDAAVRPGRTA